MAHGHKLYVSIREEAESLRAIRKEIDNKLQSFRITEEHAASAKDELRQRAGIVEACIAAFDALPGHIDLDYRIGFLVATDNTNRRNAFVAFRLDHVREVTSSGNGNDTRVFSGGDDYGVLGEPEKWLQAIVCAKEALASANSRTADTIRMDTGLE